MAISPQTKALHLFKRLGIVRVREIERIGVPRSVLYGMEAQGLITRKGRGLFALADAPITERHSYAQATKVAPRGVICLLSALRFHGLTMQNPAEVWIAIPRQTWAPKSESLKLRIVRFADKALAQGIENHRVEGVTVSVTDVARTVVDCFKFRNKIGTDVAVEALQDAWKKKLFKMDDLWRYARAFRMSRVISPYLETLS